MAKKSQITIVGKRKIELTNLDKILYPHDSILKAEVISYYLQIAPYILHHIKGRALTLIRYPDGIHAESFYQKNRPTWSPDWIDYVSLGKEEKKAYVLATEDASLVWLANLATIEIHQLHSRVPNVENPDYMVFDLDPPENYKFPTLVSWAITLKDEIERYGYTPFVKTTGGKGVHICCPIQPIFDFTLVFQAAQEIAQQFVKKYPKDITLQLKKDARKGRLFLDIYRIRTGQSIVSPYSLRGKEKAPVSMPITWETLENLKSPLEYTIQTVVEVVKDQGDAWEGFDAYSAILHTQRAVMISNPKQLPTSAKHKSPEQLSAYKAKRDFSKTKEPDDHDVKSEGDSFVVHRHHATRLHYDLRLEMDGVLKSWAVPKGLPPYPGVKRLAVQTEDHPLAYLTFDGKIPKGEYGAGEMWIYTEGKYRITKQKKNGFYFKISTKKISGEYRMHEMKPKEWLLERVDTPRIDFLHTFIPPMLCESTDQLQASTSNFLYEVKWDGIRVSIVLEDGRITLYSRNGNMITNQFPELVSSNSFNATCGVFDGEIVVLDIHGKPVFKNVISRLMGKSTAKKYQAVCYVFDCLYLDGKDLTQDPLHKRKVWMTDAIKSNSAYRISETFDDGQALLNVVKQHDLEGIIAKEKLSIYTIGKRSTSWLKLKVKHTRDCFIIGYTKGKGDRHALFGALHMAEQQDTGWIYRGKVGTGFSIALQNKIHKLLQHHTRKNCIKVHGSIQDTTSTVWVDPKIVIEVRYTSITADSLLRDPIFIALKTSVAKS